MGGVEADGDRAVACWMAAGAREVRRGTTGARGEALWKGRKKAFGAMGRIAPDLLVQDATVPRTRLPEVLRGVAEIGERYDLKIANVFHAGDGNLHPNILFDRQNEDEVARVERASREIMARCVSVGGTRRNSVRPSSLPGWCWNTCRIMCTTCCGTHFVDLQSLQM